MIGKVILVGAGPYHVKLLTLAAVEEIKKAEVVVYDRLVSEEIMALVPRGTEKINVGKNVGHHPVKQERINEILVEKAKEGKRVVRLKGGDGFLFGRGGEELELIKENQIPFKVIPGISSSLSVPTFAGIPVTHRDYCSSVHIITGHRKQDGTLDMDYDALVRLDGTLVFMMSVSSSPHIMEKLMEAGMDGDMPAGIVERGSSPFQRKVITTVGNLKEDIEKNQIESPAIVIVGKVCQLDFDWYGKLPLLGKKVLVTRPRKKSSEMAAKLRENGAYVTVASTIDIEAVECELPDLSSFTKIVFSSANGVDSFFKALRKKGKDARALGNHKVATIGLQTEKTLLKYGISSDFTPSVYEGKIFAEEMCEQGFLGVKDQVLILRGNISMEHLQEKLNEKEIPYEELVCYKTSYIKEKDLDLNEYDCVAFTSASAVKSFVANYDKYEQLLAFCIGPTTEEEAKKHGFKTQTSKEALIDSVILKIKEHYNDLQSEKA